MSTSSSSPLYPNTETNASHSRIHINPILWFDDCDGYRVIFCRHEILYRVALDDSAHLALVAVTLRLSKAATQIEIAKAFGHAVATQRRWETRYAEYGSAGLQPKSSSGRPAKLDRGQRAFVQRWFQQGVSNHEMARRLAVSEATIRRALRKAGLRRQTLPEPELPFDDANATLAASATAPAPVAGVAPVDEPAPVTMVPGEVIAPTATGINADPTAANNVP